MNLAKRSALWVLFSALFYLLPAQNILISYTKSDSLFVCNSDTFTVMVQNNNLAVLTGASLTMNLPSGLTYVAGTVTGAGQQNISNLSAPVFVLPDVPANQSATLKIMVSADCNAADALDAGQLFIANIAVSSALGNAQVSTSSIPVETGAIIASNGLPGVNLNPQNAFHIRFKTIAECGFVSNTPILYGTQGTEPCGRQANVLNKPGEAININGLNPTYGVQISIQPTGNIEEACGIPQQYTVILNILGTPSTGDSVYILLPQGVTFFINSYSPGLNAPPGPVTLNPAGFQVPLPLLQGGGTVEFSFFVQYEADAGCDDQTILAQTRVRTEAFCQSLGVPCDVYISTGEAIYNINPPHPQLLMTHANLSIVNGQVNVTLLVKNIGQNDVNGVIATVWKDVDGDGSVSANDILLATIQNFITIGPNVYAYLSGILPRLDSSQLCELLFVLPAEENCACDEQVLSFDNLNLEHTALNYCELQAVTLGVPAQTGFTYQWQPSTDVACASCPNTVFTPDPGTVPNTPQTLTLIESSSGCTVTHTFEITFGAASATIDGNTTICEGMSTTLLATPPGIGYLWQGPGIQNPALQSQTVQGLSASQYTVTITFANGCTAADSVEIQVLNIDTTQLAGLTTCAGEPVDVLGNMTSTPGNYQIVLDNVNGCDSTIMQTLTVLPEPETEEQRVFCHGESLLVFDSLFTESGTLAQVVARANWCFEWWCFHLVRQTACTFPMPLRPMAMARTTCFAWSGTREQKW